MSIISAGLFTGTAPPPLKGTQPLYDIVRIKKQDKKFLCDALSNAIYINWTLGRSIFTPSGIMIPTWNIPFLSRKITDAVDILPLQMQAKSATQKAIIQATREIVAYDVEEYRIRSDRFD